MATISRFIMLRHLRSDPTAHVLHYSGGRKVHSGRGLSFWFLPLSASIAEIPCDDRDQPFLFHGRTSDFQDVTVQGTITYRVVDAESMAPRIDFTIDPSSGHYRHAPLDQLSKLLMQLAQQVTSEYTTRTTVLELLAHGVDEIRSRIRDGLTMDASLQEMGLEIVSVRVSRITPTPELEKALQAPTRESIQQESDQAVFQRRAMAVEKERAIEENELQNRIELARREEELIAQEGQNRRREAQEEAQAEQIRSEAVADRTRLKSRTKAEGIRVVENARVEADRNRMEVYGQLPGHVMIGLAARELAGNLKRIDRLNLSSEPLGPLLHNLIESGIDRLEESGQETTTAVAAPPSAVTGEDVTLDSAE